MAADAARQVLEAQQRYAQAMAETQVMLHKMALDAQREYANRIQEAQHDLETFNLEAYQHLLSSQVERGAAAGGAPLAETYQEYVRLTTELFTQSSFRDEVSSAYSDLVTAVRAAKGKDDAANAESEAYRKYVERLDSASKRLEALQRDAAQAYAAMTAAWNDEISRQQEGARSAYQTYLDNLKEAYERSDFERRAAGAANDYVNALQSAWKDAQNVHTDVSLGLIDAQRASFEKLRRG